MSKRSLFVGPFVAAAILVFGCREPITAPETLATAPATTGRAPSAGDAAARPPLDLPSSLASISQLFGVWDSCDPHGPPCLPKRPVCLEESLLSHYLGAELGRVRNAGEESLWNELYAVYAELIPTYEAIYFQTTATPQYFGYTGEFTKVIAKTERDVKRFWDIPSSEIQVLGIHGTMLLDQERTYRTYRLLNFPDGIAASYAHRAADALGASTAMHGGNYVYFTYGSASYREAGLPDKIVIGDGILEAYAAIGYGDVAPQAILAHEYAHQIQYENGYFHDLGAVAQNDIIRYTELMADAMAGYYLTHKRGAALNAKRVVRFLETFHQIGDCAGTKNVLHGTQDQRVAAGEFGVRVAKEARKQGHILSSAQFHDLFLAYYPTLIASTP